MRHSKPGPLAQIATGVVPMSLMVWAGIEFPIYADADTWRYIVFAYVFAAVMPLGTSSCRATTSSRYRPSA